MSDTYLGNRNLKKTYVPVDWTPELVKEFVKCSKDPVYFIKSYVKIVHVDKGFVNFDLWDFQEDIIRTAEQNRFVICKLPRQVGKALDINTDIPTSSGWKKMSDVIVGDTVYDMNGNPTKVIFKSETHLKDTFKITFSDGTEAVACKDHKWYGFNYHGTNKFRKELREFTTQEIFDNGVYLYNSKREFRYAIPLCDPVAYEHKKLPIDPYVLGLWLGDGSSSNACITILEDDFNSIKHLIPYEYSIKRYDKNNNSLLTVKFEGLYALLRENNLLKNKHIPEAYLLSSIEQRRRLLAGLLDTDGTVNKYSVSFTQALFRQNLVNQVRELISSLGYKVSDYYYKSDNPSITIRFVAHDAKSFFLKRKADKQQLSLTTKTRKKQIIKIEQVDTIPTQCIEVDSPTHTFLCTKDYTVTHNTTTIAAYILHSVLFNENYSVAILAHKAEQAREILGRIQLAYEALPKWLQQGIIKWNEGSVEIENGSKILASSTASSAIRGTSQNLVYLDEFAFVPNHIQEEFFASVYPTITSGKTSKVLITSTPKGLNLFYKLWKDSEDNRNDYKRIEVHWSQVPGRDQAWKEEVIRNTSEEQFREEFECEFLGSSSTLISGSKLRLLTYSTPIKFDNNLRIYSEPTTDRLYMMTVDTARGREGDYSAFKVFDVTELPYKDVATYRDNLIDPTLYPNVIAAVAKHYNNAYILVEVNDIGQQVADILQYELEYDNMLFTANPAKKGVELSAGFRGISHAGVRTSSSVKKIGCSNFKTLIENDKLLINDFDTIQEMFRFVHKGTSFEAEEGNDDLVMCCVLFSWMTDQVYFRDLTSVDFRKRLEMENEHRLEENLLPFGIKDDGNEVFASYEEPKIVDLENMSFEDWLRN